MITKFELFERSSTGQLVDDIDQSYIEEWYDENFDISVEEVVELFPSLAFDHVDDDRYVSEYIDSEIDSLDVSDFDKDDYIKYLENESSDDKNEKIIELYLKNYVISDDKIEAENEGTVHIINIGKKTIIEIEYETGVEKFDIGYDWIIKVKNGDKVDNLDIVAHGPIDINDVDLSDFDEDELCEIITDSNEEQEFKEYIINDRYKNYDAKDIIENIYGSVDRMEGKDVYNILQYYIDDDKLIDAYKEGEDYEYKKERFCEEIYRNETIQQKILDESPKNVLILAELFVEEKDDDNISGDYDFQKMYIEQFVLDNLELDDNFDYIHDEKEESELRAKALKYLNDNFELNSQIEEEFEVDMWLTSTDKYNM